MGGTGKRLAGHGTKERLQCRWLLFCIRANSPPVDTTSVDPFNKHSG